VKKGWGAEVIYTRRACAHAGLTRERREEGGPPNYACSACSFLSFHIDARVHTRTRKRTRTHARTRRTRARPPHRVLHLAQDVDLGDHHPPLLGVHPPVAELLPNQHLPDANQPTRARASGHANGIGKGTCAHVRVNGRTHRNASAPTRASIGIRMLCVRAIVQADIGRIQFTGVCMYQCRREIPGLPGNTRRSEGALSKQRPRRRSIAVAARVPESISSPLLLSRSMERA
jgi:hypothetical protein